MMQMLSHREVQECELQILLAFHEYCAQKAIRYSLGGGSLIGAVRHKGFIPWDDDIDVFMVRAEYDRLMACLKADRLLIGDRYKAFLPFENDYYYPFLKIVDLCTGVEEGCKRPIKDMGVWIDVFPIDYCGDTEGSAKELAGRQKELVIKYYKCIMQYPNDTPIHVLKNVYLFGYRALCGGYRNDLMRQCERLSQNGPSQYSGTVRWAFTEKDVYPSQWFAEYTTALFENHEVQIFKDWDRILTHRYGDYMALPREEDRQSHTLKAWYRE